MENPVPVGPQIRLLVCPQCESVEMLPDYPPEADPLRDVSLIYADVKHGSNTQMHHPGMQRFRIAAKDWENEDVKKQVLDGIWEKTTGFTPEYYEVKNTLMDDALKCHIRHNRQIPCIDWHDSSKLLNAPTGALRRKLAKELPRGMDVDRDRLAKGAPKDWLCTYCLSGDTEVVTRTGLHRIDSLVGKPVELLVPIGTQWGAGTAARGSFKPSEVSYFGEQELWEIEMQRGSRTHRVVRATADHRWFTRDGETTTAALNVGDRLLPIKATGPRDRELPVRFLMAQGVVFGDGSHGHNDLRPAHLPLYNEGKDGVLLDLFQGHAINTSQGFSDVRSLPREWKLTRPTLGVESRSGLLSWLAGYFAADGTVDSNGAATLTSADRGNMEYVRSLGAVCGVTVGQVRTKIRSGFGRPPAPIYDVSIGVENLPEWFWLIDNHRARVQKRAARKPTKRDWVVKSVIPTGQVEPVYCGTVDGIGAFALSDDLLTGNCPVSASVEHAKRVARGLD